MIIMHLIKKSFLEFIHGHEDINLSMSFSSCTMRKKISLFV
jgi:hypothetical protein